MVQFPKVRKSVLAASVSAMLIGASVTPAAAQARFPTFFINIQATLFVIQTDRNPERAAKRLDRLNTRKPERALAVLTAMYSDDPEATNVLLSAYIDRNPTAAQQLINDLHQAGIPVSPT